jgi:adenylate cyclase
MPWRWRYDARTMSEVANGVPNLIWSPAGLRIMHASVGDSLVAADHDGTLRHFGYSYDRLTSFGIAVADVAGGRTIKPNSMEHLRAYIDYGGPAGSIPSYSYSRMLPETIQRRESGRGPWDVLVASTHLRIASFANRSEALRFRRRNEIPLARLRDKIVLIGASAPSLQDVHTTPFGPGMAGAEVQANIIHTALRGFPLRGTSRGANFALIIVLGLLPALIGFFLPPLPTFAATVAAAGLFSLATQLAFNAERVVSFTGSLAVHYVLAAFERERVRDIFARFVPEQCVDQVLAQTGSDLRLRGEEVVTTVMFSDLRNFTSRTEAMPAADVIDMLNEYLHDMSEAILAHEGTVLCYTGDGIFAMFGAPIEQADHADRAVAAAREMVTERLPQLDEWMKNRGLGEGFRMGIGLNTGPVMTGNVGHARRMDYTAVGDVINTASRIEALTKDAPFSILLAESTADALNHQPQDLLFWNELEIEGRQATVRLWGLDTGVRGESHDEAASYSLATVASPKGP